MLFKAVCVLTGVSLYGAHIGDCLEFSCVLELEEGGLILGLAGDGCLYICWGDGRLEQGS